MIAAGALWLALLFGVALYGERHPGVLSRHWGVVYALSLAIHCTSWTFYGTVTQASRSGWWLPPTFVGAVALYAFGAFLMVRLVRLARESNAGSLADVIAARLGRHSGLAALVTAVMLVGIVPYIALQLKAVAMSFGVLGRGQVSGAPAWQDSALYVALAMALFAMLFGTRRAAATEHNRGLVLAIAFESVFKLFAMLVLGAVLLLTLDPAVPVEIPPTPADTSGFPALILLGALAMFAMPHQFHAGVTECRDASHVRTARWLFPLYLLLIALPVLPLARLGDKLLGPVGVPSDLYVLALPMSEGMEGMALLAFLGGLSAATSMVVVATLALSLMVANHFVAPLRVRAGWGRAERGDLRGQVLMLRRVAILVIVLLAWGYSRLLARSDALADIGAISFSALAGLGPATLVAMYRPQIGARAVAAGLVCGTLMWLYALLPALLAPQPAWLAAGPLGIGWLAPDHLLRLDSWSPLGRAVVLNLVVNFVVTILVARSRFGQSVATASSGGLAPAKLRALAERFLTADRVAQLFDTPAAARSLEARVEHELAAMIGASSAHLLIDVVRSRAPGELDTVADIVDEATEELRFNQRVLQAALENMSQGICVVNADLEVVAWNLPYAELFDYPPGMLAIGRPVAALTRHNIAHGLIGACDIEHSVERRLQHMRAGTAHLSERRLPDGKVVEIRGNPMPGGGYVATFTDVTAFRSAEDALRQSNENLEQRVGERTRELGLASAAADRANRAKTQFLAAVSHDLMQPLHAAQLFSHALAGKLVEEDALRTAHHLDGSLLATENLLTGLLDIARLEGGGLEPQFRDFALAELLDPLAAEFRALGAERGVRVDQVHSSGWGRSDPQLLRRVLQNFLGNALRYVEGGRVVLGCRRRAGNWRIEVWDNGPGIASDEQDAIFEQFRRGAGASGQGLGLGLAIARRFADLLGHQVNMRSRRGRGSVFAVTVPAAIPAPAAHSPVVAAGEVPPRRVLVLDDEQSARLALATLLQSWGWQVHVAATVEDALQAPWQPELMLLDYHLGGGQTAAAVAPELQQRLCCTDTIVLTADRDPVVRAQLQEMDIQVLYKPLKPLALRQLLQRRQQAVSAARREAN